MMKICVVVICVVMIPIVLPAQGISNGTPFQVILDNLYKDMKPMCKGLIDSARLIGGFGALWYIGLRVWRSIAIAEPVDVYGLLRPFVLGFCILVFPSVIDLINGILYPTVKATALMVKNSHALIEKYLRYKAQHASLLEAFNPANWIRAAIQGLLEFLFETVALLIHAIRTFYLIVLAIIGPLVFGLSIFDGFQHLITVWLARYINVFLWLPVANIFGAIIAKIQEHLVSGIDYSTPIPGQPFSLSDWAYLAFLLIAIVGYCTVPSVSNYIVNAGGGNTLLHKVTSFSVGAAKSAGSAMTGMASDAFGNAASKMSSGMSETGVSSGYFKDKIGK
ncbi:conjugative transposon protein TraJ [Sediminibacterium sp.]|uniref:conjugative transposon protein TraJ n=1 Tax=Sediminibacterium sp. TaxID=1917865 RepID=UPI003F6A3701